MPALRERFDFVDERGGIDDHAGADHRVAAGTQNSARDELQNVAIAADDDGMAGVVAAGYARDVFERTGEIVDDLAFAFIAPLRAYHYDRVHSDLSYDARSMPCIKTSPTRTMRLALPSR